MWFSRFAVNYLNKVSRKRKRKQIKICQNNKSPDPAWKCWRHYFAAAKVVFSAEEQQVFPIHSWSIDDDDALRRKSSGESKVNAQVLKAAIVAGFGWVKRQVWKGPSCHSEADIRTSREERTHQTHRRQNSIESAQFQCICSSIRVWMCALLGVCVTVCTWVSLTQTVITNVSKTSQNRFFFIGNRKEIRTICNSFHFQLAVQVQWAARSPEANFIFTGLGN